MNSCGYQIKTETRFRQFLDTYNPNAENVVELKAQLEKAENLLAEFNNCQDQIRDLDIEDTLKEELNAENEVFEPLYFRAIAKARSLVPGNL